MGVCFLCICGMVVGMKLSPCSLSVVLVALIVAACGGTTSTPTPTAAATGAHQPYTHVASCLTALALGSPQNAHRFAVAVLPNADRTQLTLEMTPVRVKAPTLIDADVLGDLITLADIPVSKSGLFSYSSPAGSNLQIPGDANPLSGARIILEKLDMSGKLDTSAPRFCGSFVAKIIEPVTLKGNDISAVCVFEQKTLGSALPVLTNADFDACSGSK